MHIRLKMVDILKMIYYYQDIYCQRILKHSNERDVQYGISYNNLSYFSFRRI